MDDQNKNEKQDTPPQNKIEITPSGVLIVEVHLGGRDGKIIALGMLEQAKQVVSAWLFNRAQAEKQAATNGIIKSKNFIDRMMRR